MTTPSDSTFQADKTQENNMTDIVWEDPAPAVAGVGAPGKYAEVLEALKANPGRWALIARNERTGGLNSWLRGKGYEVVTRSAGRGYERGYADIYARYVEDVNA